jgi:hypothetical protein
MPLAFAVDQALVREFQLLQVQVTLATAAMDAVSERPQAVAQLPWKLMHRWACLGVCCCSSCMTVLASLKVK